MTRSDPAPAAAEAPAAGRARRWLVRLGCVLLGVVLCLGAAEALYRVARTKTLGPTTNPSYSVHDPRLGWKYRPNARARHRSAEFDVTIEIGARGFRGAWPEPREDRVRVLILGDSFAFGWGVGEEQMLSSRLGAMEERFQVWNAAVSGYGTDQQKLLLEELVPELRPHFVVYVYCPNDLVEVSSSRMYGRAKPWYELPPGKGGEAPLRLRGVPVPNPWWMRSSHLARALVKTIAPRVAVDDATPGRDWILVRRLVREMADLAANSTFVIVAKEPELRQLARDVSRIELIDLEEVFSNDERSADEPLAYPLDGHWTALGHMRVAEALGRFLREP